MSGRAIFDETVAGDWAAIHRWKDEKQPESLFLEFKCKEDPTTPKLSPADKAQIGRTLSGFANTHGGVLALGVEAHGGGGKAPDHVQQLRPVEQIDAFCKRVGDVVKELTNPPISGLDVRSIREDGTDRGVVLVFVPSSIAAPHCAIGGTADVNDRYFMRTANDTPVMPHRLLAAMFGRTPPPLLQLQIRMHVVRTNGPLFVYKIRLIMRNIGRGIARQPGLLLHEESKPVESLWWKTYANQGSIARWNVEHYPDDERTTVTFRSGADTVIYPSPDERSMILEGNLGGVDNGINVMSFNQFRIRGKLLAQECQPTAFDRVISDIPDIGKVKDTYVPTDNELFASEIR